VGVPPLSAFVIKGRTIDIPLIGIFGGQVEIAFVSIAAHFRDRHGSGFTIASFSDRRIETGKAAMVGQITKAVDVADTGTDADEFGQMLPDWKEANSMSWGRLRYDTAWMNIAHHTDDRRLRILDVGGGDGMYAIRYARLGHSVTLTDCSPTNNIRHPLPGFGRCAPFDPTFPRSSVRFGKRGDVVNGNAWNLVIDISTPLGYFGMSELYMEMPYFAHCRNFGIHPARRPPPA